MDNYEKMSNYFKIKRENGEKMKDYLVRYEKLAGECERAMGKKMFEGEFRAFHVLEQANLNEQQKQLALSACGKDKLDYSAILQILNSEEFLKT